MLLTNDDEVVFIVENSIGWIRRVNDHDGSENCVVKWFHYSMRMSRYGI